MVVQHQTNLLVLRIGTVEFHQEADEVGAFVRVAEFPRFFRCANPSRPTATPCPGAHTRNPAGGLDTGPAPAAGLASSPPKPECRVSRHTRSSPCPIPDP